MADKSRLIENVKEWIHLDNQLKEIRERMKAHRNRKKEITSVLVSIMKTNDIDCFDITDGKLFYNKKNVKKPLTKKHLLASLAKYFDNNNVMVKELSTFIMNSRENNIKEDIRRKFNIK
jgi:hypothetical protein